MAESIFDTNVPNNAEGRLYRIINLCRVGVAASDTTMSIDLSKGGHTEMYEVIYGLASEAIDLLETRSVFSS